MSDRNRDLGLLPGCTFIVGLVMRKSIRPATAGTTQPKKISRGPKQRTRFAAGGAGAPSLDCPDRVRTFVEWCRLNSFSEDTGRRILASGKGPRVLQLSPNRIGVRDSDNRDWQNSIVRGAK